MRAGLFECGRTLLGWRLPGSMLVAGKAGLGSHGLNERDYAALIDGLGRSNDWAGAVKLLLDAQAQRLSLKEPTWNKIVSAAGRKRAWHAAISLFQQYSNFQAGCMTA